MGKPSQTRPIISAEPENVVMAEDRFPHGIRVPGGKVTPLPREATVEENGQYPER